MLPLDEQQLVDLYNQDWSTHKIARELNLSSTTVASRISKHMPLRPAGWRPQRVKHAKTVRMIELHQSGKSTYEIAHELGMVPNTVRKILTYHKVMRQAVGRDVEVDVAIWLMSRCRSVRRMKGDWPFDLLADGERIDVKSSNRSTDGRYHFELIHREAPNKVLSEKVDWVYMVILDQPRRPIWCLPAEATTHVALAFKDPAQCIYPLLHLGYLDDLPRKEGD